MGNMYRAMERREKEIEAKDDVIVALKAKVAERDGVIKEMREALAWIYHDCGSDDYPCDSLIAICSPIGDCELCPIDKALAAADALKPKRPTIEERLERGERGIQRMKDDERNTVASMPPADALKKEDEG